MALRLASFALIRVALSTITLDDMDEGHKGLNVHSVNMQKDGLEACRADAHSGNFHHDGAANKGSAHFEFKFEIEQDGCYSLEEYHPGSAGNSQCSELLATNAQLEVEWCIGKKSLGTIDQSKHGGLWNFVGIFPYFVGHPGVVRMSNTAGFAGQHLVVDAFRLTRVADRCTNSLQNQLWRADQARKQVAQQKAAPAPASMLQPSTKEGTLLLSLQSDAGAIELLASLKSQAATLETTLKNHLKASSVAVLDILPVDARRLDGCRRLQAVSEALDFHVNFRAEVTGAMSVSEAMLASELATAFDAASANFQLESLELQWQSMNGAAKQDSEAEGDSDSMLTAIFVAFLALTVVVLVCLVQAWRRYSWRRASKEVNVTKELEDGQQVKSHDPTDPPETILKEDAVKVDVESIDDNASTATPASDPAVKDTEVVSNEQMETE